MIKKEKEIKVFPSIEEYLSWDIYIWSNALNFWRNLLNKRELEKCFALEIGSKGGGLTLFLSLEFGIKTLCTDKDEISNEAKQLHKKYCIENLVTYSIADVSSMNFEADFFDVIIFKSVLGSVGKNENNDKLENAMDEIYRVLKPGGIVLFAENAKGSIIHSSLRKIFRRWAEYWKYFSIDEMESLLKNFSKNEIHTSGVISAFFPGNNLKKIIFPLDNFIEKITPKKYHYMLYGYAVK